jgi:hypothetical protein
MADDTLYQNADNRFLTSVTSGIDGSSVSATVFPDAFYVIADKRGEVLIQKTLGDGITVDGDNFKVFIDDGELTFFGNYTHQFSVQDVEGNILPPVFQRKVKIIKTIKRRV